MTNKETPVDLSKTNCDSLLVSWKDEFKEIRKDFHRHPEIGLETKETSRKIAELLRSYGVDEVHEGIGGCGVVGIVKGRTDNGKSIGLRADIDALPLNELADHDHVSCTSGCMHACGHDGHGATLLAVAKYLVQTRNFDGKAVLIFQPGEEGWSGARHMIEDGLFERFPADEVYAYHNNSGLPQGIVALNDGTMQGSADAFTIRVSGHGGHGSRPHLNQDTVLAAANIIVALQSIVSRSVDPLKMAVVSCCSIHAGDPRAQSVMPQSCEIVGTARAFDPDVRDVIERRIGEIADCTAKTYGCVAETIYQRFYPPCVNTPEQARFAGDIASEVVGSENVIRDMPGSSGGEDFAFMLEKKPGAYFKIGQGGAAAHNPHFDFNDEIIPVAATIMARIIEKRLAFLNQSK